MNNRVLNISQAFQIALLHHEAGRLDEAEAAYRQILSVQPQHPDALHLLGVVALQGGHHEIALELITQSILFNPSNPAAYSNIGEAYRMLGRLNEAIANYRRAIALYPEYPEAYFSLGNALSELGKPEEAIANLRRAIDLKPKYAEAQNNLGAVLARRGQIGEAIACYRHALNSRPDLPDAHNNLGAALVSQGQLSEAIAVYQRAIALKPDYPEAFNNLGNALKAENRLGEAAAALRHAIELRSDYSEAHSNLGNVLKERGELDAAVNAYRQALKFKPAFSGALLNLGNALSERGELDEALIAYRRAIQIEPENPIALSNFIYMVHFHPLYNDKMIAEEWQRWNRLFGEPLKHLCLAHTNNRTPDRRLRIGYVSPDFRDHVTGRFLIPLFRCHNLRDFEVVCYAGVVRPDKITDEFRQYAQLWRNTVGMGNEVLAELIRRDGVDILVDLTQHMAGNRLPMFARKPAPVQVSFAGYPDSTGLETIEFRISDRYLEPDQRMERIGRNEFVYLIDSFWCYDPCGVEVEVNELPAKEGGFITFGNLNNFCKVNAIVLRLWAQVLRKVKHSRLLLLSKDGSHRQRTRDALEREGVQASRLEFVGYQPRREYLELHHRLDIVLDSFPSNGHTTSLDALWMGVPVVSLPGTTPVSRAGLSQLTNLGLSELVAHSKDDYVRIAAELANDLPRLAQLRSSLRDRMKISVLMDAQHFTRQVEQAYRSMWQHWCSNPK